MERRSQLAVTGITILSITLAVLHDAHTLLTTAHLAGRDLAANLMLATQTGQYLLEGLFTFEPDLFLGITTFRYYPPGFFVLAAILGQAIGIITATKLLALLPVIGLPPAVWYMTRSWGQDLAAGAAVLSLIPVYVYQPISIGYQTLSTGLVAQGLALLLFTMYATCLHRGKDLGAALLLGATIITHPFVGMVGVMYGSVRALHRRDLRPLILVGAGILLTTWWWLPALQVRWLLPAFTFPPAEPGIILMLLGPPALAAAWLVPRSRPLAATTGILLLLSLAEVPVITQELRLYTQAVLLLAITAGIGGAAVSRLYSGKLRTLMLAAVLVPAIGLAAAGDIGHGWDGPSRDQAIDALQQLEPGRVLVETSDSAIFTSYQLSSTIVRRTDHSAVNGLHVDSSPSSPYILALEDWISQDAIYNPVCRGCNTTPSAAVISTRLQDLGVDYLITGEDLTIPMVRPDQQYPLLYHVSPARFGEPIDPQPFNGSWTAWMQRNTAIFTSLQTPDIVYTGPQVTVPDRVFTEPETPVNYSINRTRDQISIDHTGSQAQAFVIKLSYLPAYRSPSPLFITTFNRLGVLVPPEGTTVHLSP